MILSRQRARHLTTLLVVMMVGALASPVCVRGYFARSCPLTPSEPTNHIYPVHLAWSIFYLNPEQHRVMTAVDAAGWLLFFVCVVSFVYVKSKESR